MENAQKVRKITMYFYGKVKLQKNKKQIRLKNCDMDLTLGK